VRHNRLALYTIGAAVVIDAVLGALYSEFTPGLPLWHGLYCALANAVTDGGDVTPVNDAGYAIQACEYVTVVPLVAAAFSLFTSALSSVHIRPLHHRLDRVETLLTPDKDA
jgi:hypothetical protein